MQDSIDSEPMHAHSLHHRVPLVAIRIVVPLVRVERNSLSLLVSENFAHCSILGVASITLVHLLDDAKQLAL